MNIFRDVSDKVVSQILNELRKVDGKLMEKTTDIVGVGLRTDGQGTPIIEISVSRYRSFHRWLEKIRIAGVRVEVVETGEFSAEYVVTPKYRPVPGGASVGIKGTTDAGTAGGTVYLGGAKRLISNSHVLADYDEVPIGTRIVQPGGASGEIGYLSEKVTIDRVSGNNYVDVALATADDPSNLDDQILNLPGPPYPPAKPNYQGRKTNVIIGEILTKSGIYTGVTTGYMSLIYTTVNIGVKGVIVQFHDQYQVQGYNAGTGAVIDWSEGGDSGSLVLNQSTYEVVGLHFAGNLNYGIVNRVQYLESLLGVTFPGTGLNVPDIAIQPYPNISFGGVATGTSSDMSVDIYNTGRTTLTINSYNVTGSPSDWSIPGTVFPLSIPVGSYTRVSIRFSPTSTGARDSLIRFAVPAVLHRPVHVLNVSGSGTGSAVPNISIDPSNWNYSTVPLDGTSYSDKVFTVTNTGAAVLHISNVLISGTNPSDFTMIGGSTSFDINPGNSSPITIRFKPTSSGNRNASLQISHNAGVGLSVVSLTGIGGTVLVPDINVTPSPSYNYGNVNVGTNSTREFQVTNTGSTTLTFTPSIIGSEFTISSGAGSHDLDPGYSYDIEVRFSPLSSGSKSATLRFTTNVPSKPTVDITITGTGAIIATPDIASDPTTGAYGDVTVGTYSDKYFRISNPGGALLTVSSFSISGDASYVIQGSTAAFTLAAGAYRDITVRFTPGSEGDKTADLRFINDAPLKSPFNVHMTGHGSTTAVPNISASPSSYDYGSIDVGNTPTQSFRITNTGTATLTINSTSIVGADAGQFNMVSGGGYGTLAPSGYRDIVVRFVPSTAGLKSSALRIDNNSAHTPFDVSLQGTGLGPVTPVISVTPSIYDYGNVGIAYYADQAFEVRNIGNANLSLLGATIVGDVSFTVIYGGIDTLAPTRATNIGVRFNPLSAGAKNATLQISSNDLLHTPYNVPLSGNSIVSPDISASPSSYNYGYVNVGTFLDATIRISNSGSSDLVVSSTTLIGTGVAHFGIVSGGDSFTITRGNSRNVVVRFAPSSVGNKSVTLRFDTNVVGKDPFNVSLSGSGSSGIPFIDVHPSFVNFGNVDLGDYWDNDIVIENRGDAVLTISSLTFTGLNPAEFSIVSGGVVPFNINPDDDHTVLLRFSPSTSGFRTATLQIGNNDPTQNPYPEDLYGTGVSPAPDISSSPASWDYGIEWYNKGDYEDKIFLISNPGSLQLDVSGSSIVGDASFTIIDGGGGFSLSPSGTRNVTVRFAPHSSGSKSAVLRFSTNIPGEPTFDVSLSGEGDSSSSSSTSFSYSSSSSTSTSFSYSSSSSTSTSFSYSSSSSTSTSFSYSSSTSTSYSSTSTSYSYSSSTSTSFSFSFSFSYSISFSSSSSSSSFSSSSSSSCPQGPPESGSIIRWYRNGRYVQAFDNKKTIVATGKRGDIWYFTVTPSDGVNYGDTVQSAPGIIINSPPTSPTFCEIVPHNPQLTDNLYVVCYGATDADGDSITYHVNWFRNSSELISYRNKFMIPYTELREDDVFSVNVRAYDGFEESE